MSGSYDPWSAIIGQIVAGAARNMGQTGAGATSSERGGYGYENKQPGMVYQAAPAMESNHVSPTAQIMQATGGIPVAQQKQVPGVGDALKGEEQMLRNVTPSQGGFMQAPTDYHSDTPWSQPYLKYAQYGQYPQYSSAIPSYSSER